MIVKLAIGLPLGSALRSATKGLSQAVKSRTAPLAAGASTPAQSAVSTAAAPVAKGVGTGLSRLAGAGHNITKTLQPLFMGTALGGAGLSAYQAARGMYDYSSGQLDGAGDMAARAADAFRQMPAWQRLGLAIAPETAMDSKAVHRALAEKITGAPDWKTRWFGPVVYGRAMEGIKRLRAGQPLAGLPDSNTLFGQTAEMYDKKHLKDLVGLYEKLKATNSTGVNATTAPSS